jgi:hypothetical protein
MDNFQDVVKVQSSERQSYPFHYLRRITPEWKPERIQWLWEKLQTQEYAFDDPGRGRGDFFLARLFDPNTISFEFGEDGMVFATEIIRKVNAVIHFAVWGEVDQRDLILTARELLSFLFQEYGLVRVTGMIPSFNKATIRLATICGFKYEGEMRKAFLKNGTYHNLHIYGILRDEFMKREVLH